MTPLGVLTVAAIGAWLGIMAFFSFVATPILFRTMERSVAGAAAAAVLPGYYACGLVLGATALLALVLWSLVIVLPAAEAARGAADSTGFSLVHRRAVSLNALTMLGGVIVLALEMISLRRERPSASLPGP